MAITIKELLAADTISQAADKINFNFDQLLLNGGGPVGPPGPDGPPGPIGGRGIRGSLWFEGPGVPAITPDLEPEDNYLQGSISTSPLGDGDVYNFNGTAWVFTGINLTGPVGPQGISADWSVFGNPLAMTGDCLYPEEAPTIAPPKTAINSIRSVLFGGVPESFNLSAPIDYTVPDAMAENMNSDDSALYVHVPQGDRSFGGPASVKFSGGQVGYSEDVNELISFRLLEDDLFSLEDVKASNTMSYGMRFYSHNRSELHEIGRSFKVSTGNHDTGPVGGAPLNGNITLEVSKEPNGGLSNSEIRLIKTSTAGNSAQFYLGTTKNSAFSHGSRTGNIWSDADEQYMYSKTQTVITNQGAASRLLLSASGATLATTDQNVDISTTGTGGINLTAGTGDIYFLGGGDLRSNVLNIDLRATNNAQMVANKNVTLQSTYSGTGGNTILLQAAGSVGVEDQIRCVATGNMVITGSNGTSSFGTGAQLNVVASHSGNVGNMNICSLAMQNNTPPKLSLFIERGLQVGGSTTYTAATDGICHLHNTVSTQKEGLRIQLSNSDAGPLGVYWSTAAKVLHYQTVGAGKVGIYSHVDDYADIGLPDAPNYARYGIWSKVLPRTNGFTYGIKSVIDAGDTGVNAEDADYYGVHIDVEQTTMTLPAFWGLFEDSTENKTLNYLDHNLIIGNGDRSHKYTPLNRAGSQSEFWGAQLSTMGSTSDPTNIGINVCSMSGSNIRNLFFVPWAATDDYYNGMTVAGDCGIFWNDSLPVTLSGSGDDLRYNPPAGGRIGSNDSAGLTIGPHRSGSHGIRITSGGNVGIGTNNFSYGGSTSVHYTGTPYTAYKTWVSGSSTALLSVGGSIGCTFIATSSDERLKENIVPINSSLERILNTRPVFYTWKDPQHGNFIHGGFIGQELQKSIPEAVRLMESEEFEDGKYTIHYDTILATAVGAIQELKKENDELKTRLKLIEEKLGL